MEKKISGKKLYVYIVTAVILIIAISQLCWINHYYISDFLPADIIFIIPLIITLIMLITSLFGIYEKYEFIRIFTNLCLIIAVILMSFHWFLFTLRDDRLQTQDPSDYSKVLNNLDYPDNNYISHFPQKLTSDMTDIRMMCSHKNTLILIYKTTPQTIENIKTESSSHAKRLSHEKASYLKKHNIFDRYVADRLYMENNKGDLIPLPDDFEVQILDYEIYREDVSFDDGEHETFTEIFIYGIAVSHNRGEVLYFYDRSYIYV